MEFLDKINNPSDIKKLNIDELKILARELRQTILDTVIKNGGHLASSLGVVEIIIAMHYVFNAPQDKLIFDVGHQCYAHKLLTGRYGEFSTLRQKNGLSGFPKRCESEYDTLDSGHSATSLSAACGITRALKSDNDEHIAVSLIGDGALTGGMAYEALNDSDEIGKSQIIILNDNSMSISDNVGSTAHYLLRLHASGTYRRAKSAAHKMVESLNMDKDNFAMRIAHSAKNSLKYFIQGGMPFEQFGLRYFGPIDGHDLKELIEAFEIAKNDKKSVLIHVITTKGKGYREAELNPQKYHGYGKSSGNGYKNFSAAFGESMIRLAKSDDKVYAVTAAMTDGVGLEKYASEFPERFADVGIAEQHAVTMSAGLALMKYKPYFAVYSSFLQRACDQVIHDVALQNLPVTLCIDRAGLVPGDGETHQGIYDIAILRVIPDMTIAAPRNNTELDKLMQWSLHYNRPLAIRYPKGGFPDEECDEIELGKWEILHKSNAVDTPVIIATGASMIYNAKQSLGILLDKGIDAELVNGRFIKPLDENYLNAIANRKIITIEDNLIAGGFGSAVMEYYASKGIRADITVMGVDNKPLEHATVAELQSELGLDVDSIVKQVMQAIEKKA